MESSSSSSEPDKGYNTEALLTLSEAAERIHEIQSNQDSKGKAVLEPSEAPEEVNEAHADQAPKEVHEAQADQNPEVEPWKREPEWLDRFIKNTYHEPCSEHNKRRNELNLYCIDCDKIFCQFCLLDPKCRDCSDHRIMKIYRHVYKNVIPIVEIVLHMDCSQIQPYRSNKLRVLAMSPLPHLGGKFFKDNELCLVCTRKLADPNKYSYCSILCKLEAFRNKKDVNSPPFLFSDFPEKFPAVKTMVKGEPIEAAYAATPETENVVAEQQTAMTGDEKRENKNEETEQHAVITGGEMMENKNENAEPAIKAPVAKPKVENKPNPEVKVDEDDNSDSEDDDDFGDSDSEGGMDADLSDDDDDSEESEDEKPANEPEEAGKKRPGVDAETPQIKKAKIATLVEQQAAMTGDEQMGKINEDGEQEAPMNPDQTMENENEDSEQGVPMNVDEPMDEKKEVGECGEQSIEKINEDAEQQVAVTGECGEQPIEKINEDAERQVAVTGECGDQSLEKTEDVKQKAIMIGDEDEVDEPNEDEVDEPVKTENPKPVITYRKRDRKGVPIHALLP